MKMVLLDALLNPWRNHVHCGREHLSEICLTVEFVILRRKVRKLSGTIITATIIIRNKDCTTSKYVMHNVNLSVRKK